jgi:hypothetical protein
MYALLELDDERTVSVIKRGNGSQVVAGFAPHFTERGAQYDKVGSV